MEGEEVQEEVVLRQQGVVLEKAECQEDSHLLPLLDRFHDQKGTYLLSYRNPFHHNLYSVSLAVEVFRRSCGPAALHGILTSFQ